MKKVKANIAVIDREKEILVLVKVDAYKGMLYGIDYLVHKSMSNSNLWVASEYSTGCSITNDFKQGYKTRKEAIEAAEYYITNNLAKYHILIKNMIMLIGITNREENQS